MSEEGLEEFKKKLVGFDYNTKQLISKAKLKSEEDVKSAVLEPLLKLLGWDVSNLDQVRKELTVEGGFIDYALLHNGKVKAIIEAKAYEKSLDGSDQTKAKGKRTFVEQTINYAYNHPDGVNWALLTNGAEWRLYNAYFKGSIEQKLVFKLPLEKLVKDSNKLSLLSRESIESGETDKKFRNRPLRKPVDVEIVEFLLIARDKLTTSIHNKNKDKYDIETLRIGIQRILDRLLFFKICEDRDILDFGRLRDFFHLYTEKMLSKDSFVQGLKNFFRDFDNVYNGDMFAPHPCEDFLVENEVYKFIINGLYEYDFATINVDILGRIYENYLGNTLQSLEKGLTWTPDPSERKKFGQYYTPQYVVDYIIESVGITKDSKVLDPACGSGAFLIKAYDKLKTEYGRYNEGQLKNSPKGKIDTNISMVKDVPNEILTKNLYGVDLNPEAVEISKINLWLRSIRKDTRLSNLDHKIEVGNSLISGTEEELKVYFENSEEKRPFNWEERFSDVFSEGGFDAVIGNPPYVQLSMDRIDPKEKKYFIKKYGSSMGRLNTFGFFIKLGIELLKEDGRLGFIVPNTLLTQDYYSELRDMVLGACKIESIVSFSELPFKDAVVENIIIVLQKEDSKEARNSNIIDILTVTEDLTFIKQHSIQQDFFNSTYKKSFNIFLNDKSIALTSKIEENTKQLGEYLEVNQAIALKHSRDNWVRKNKLDETYKPLLIGGKNINRYLLSWDGSYLKYDLEGIHSCKRQDIFLTPEKILFRRVGENLIATLDTQQYFALHTLVVMNLKQPTIYNLRFLLALFNSNLMDYYYKTVFKSTKRVFSEIEARQIERLPIKTINIENPSEKSIHDELVSLADKMLDLSKNLSSINTDFSRYLSFRTQLNNSKFVTYFNSLSPSDKIVLNNANMTKATVKKVRVTEDGEWLTFKVNGITINTKLKFENVEALKCKITDTRLRKFLFYSLKGLKGSNGKGIILEKILNLPIPKFSPDPHENREAIDNLMDEFLPAVAEKERLEKEIEETDKTIDQMVYKLYGLTEEEIKVVKGL